jgi:presenilin-like A22 family membrane protease
MKHEFRVTLIIVSMFLISQLLGLMILNSYDIYYGKTAEQEGVVQPEASFIHETVPPQVEIKTALDVTQIMISIIVAVALATFLFLLLSKIKITMIFKLWFTIVVFICLTLSFSLFIYPWIGGEFITISGKSVSLAEFLAIPLAAIFTYYKIFKRNLIAHNFSEIFIYPGLAVVFLPFVNLIVAALLLVAISIYDMWAVWKSKHMIKLAKFQINHLKLFTGFFFPYVSKKELAKVQQVKALEKKKIRELKKKGKVDKKKLEKEMEKELKKLNVKAQVAALGGGDVAFPLIFAGAVMFAYESAFAALLIVLGSAAGLLYLLYKSEKGKFYPAMPFISAGCFLGLFLVWLIF